MSLRRMLIGSALPAADQDIASVMISSSFNLGALDLIISARTVSRSGWSPVTRASSMLLTVPTVEGRNDPPLVFEMLEAAPDDFATVGTNDGN